MTKEIFIQIVLGLVIVSGCQRQSSVSPAVPLRTLTETDENAVAFSRLTDGYWQIWTMRPDGSNARRITSSLSDKRYPVWAEKAGRVYCRDNNNRLFSVDLKSGEEVQVLRSLGFSDGVVPSPDGNKVVVVRFDSQLRDCSSLLLTTSSGDNPRLLTRDVGLHYHPAWSPEGSRVAYIFGAGYRTDEVYAIDSDGSNKRKLTSNNAIELLPAISPDGKTIAYVSDIAGDYEIWSMNIDGSNQCRLTNSEGIDTRPCWSPDGREIMFTSRRSGQLQIWIMDSDGSNPKQLTSGAPSMDPAWRTK